MAVSLKRQPEALFRSAGEIRTGKVVETRGGETLVRKDDGKFIIRRDEELTQYEG
ncbi:hypothetical protein [Streptomyces sp. SID8499]|uniref:hypothetical protein n=1 Tax=Streptomyces sp. SID8499 TaxID=2706106 RepID=UPI0013C5A3B1|nr:hypothetical protein [Streptomyces sp. SID8499]NED36714.1 hypothetical protein [Streptomyces sp. SID8499]